MARWLSAVATAAALLALGCTHGEVRGECKVVPHVGPPGPLMCEAALPEPHVCSASPPGSPLSALAPTREPVFGCPDEVHLRPGNYADAEVLFAPESALVVLRGHGRTPLPEPDSLQDQQRTDATVERAAHGLGQILYDWGHAFAPRDGQPLHVSRPPGATHGRGVVLRVSRYGDLDPVVDGLRGWIRASDLDVEIMLDLGRPLSRLCPPELQTYDRESSDGDDCTLPPQPAPHACPPLAADSPLGALGSRMNVAGCPADVHVRPGPHPEAEIVFGCPASRDPTIILRGSGHHAFQPPAPLASWRFLDDIKGAAGELAHLPQGFTAHPPPAGPSAVHLLPLPACAARETGFVARIYSYGDVDAVVKGLLAWIQRNDLAIDVVLHIVPNTEAECTLACEG